MVLQVSGRNREVASFDSNLHPRPVAIYSGRSSCPTAASPWLGVGELQRR
jgi:hypothetical protein